MNFWSSDVQKRLCSYLLNKTVGPFLKSNLDLMSVQLFNRNGKFYLPELQLNVEKINEMLKDLPFYLIEANVGEINAEIPWWDLKNSNVSIQLKDIYLKLLIKEQQLDDELFYDVAENFMNSSSINIANEFLNQELQENINGDNNDESEGSESKVQFFSSIIDKIIAKLEIVLLNIKVNILFNIEKNKDTQINNENKEWDNENDFQKCGFDLCIPRIKLVEGSIINDNKDKLLTNIMKDIIFNEFSIHLNYYKNSTEQNENNTNSSKKNSESELFYSVTSKQENSNSMYESKLEESIFYDAKDEDQFKNMRSSFSSTNSDQSDDNYYENPLAMTQSHIYQTTCQYEFSSTKIDPNIKKSYRILSCSRNSKNVIHITHKSSKSVISNKNKNSLNINSDFVDINFDNIMDSNNDDKNNTSIEIKYNEWIFNIELEYLCLILLPKNLETIVLLINNLIPSFTTISDDNINKQSKGSNVVTPITNSNTAIQGNQLPGSFPSFNQINQISNRSSSQSLQMKTNKKPKQRNNIFSFQFNLKNFIMFIIKDEKEKICLPHFDYTSFLDGLFDSSVSDDLVQLDGFNDDFLSCKSPAEMLNEYHLKFCLNGLSFQINIISNKFYSNCNSSNNDINKNSKDKRQTDITSQFLIKSLAFSEWIDGSYNDILYTQKKYPNYNYYRKIIDINKLNSLIKSNILEGSFNSNKLDMDISNLYINFSYTIYQRLMMFISNIIEKVTIIMKERVLYKTVSNSSSNNSINDLYKDLMEQNTTEETIEEEKSKEEKLELCIRLNDIKAKLYFDEIDQMSKFNGMMIDLIGAQFNMINDIQFSTIKAGISLLSIEPEEIQTEPLIFITPMEENNFLTVTINDNIPANNDPNAFLNEFLDSHSPNDYGKFWFKERSLKQAKNQINMNINEIYLNINPDIIKGIMHIINYALDTFVNTSSSNTETNNNSFELGKRESSLSLVYDPSKIQDVTEKVFELLTINVKIKNIIISLFSYDEIYYQLSLGTFDSFIAFSNLGPYCIYITCELFNFDEKCLNSSVSFPIIQNNPFQNINHMIEVSIYSLAKDEQSSLSVLNLNIALSEMLFNIDIPCLLQLSTISNHLKDLPPIHTANDEPLALRFSLVLNNFLLGYERIELSPQLIIKFDEINIYNEDTLILGEVISLDLFLSLEKMNVLLTDHSIPPEINTDLENSLVDHLINLGYSNMLSCDILIANVNVNQSVASKLKINLSKKRSNIYFDMCPDSLATLKQLFENMLLLIPEGEKKEPLDKSKNLSIAEEIKMTIDEDVYPSINNNSFNSNGYSGDGYLKKSNSLIFDDSDACIIDYDSVQNTPNLITSKNNTVFKSKDKVVSYNNDFKIDNNYLENLLNEKKAKKNKSKLPDPIMKININNINFHIRIFDGYDWRSTCQEVQSLDEFKDMVSMEYLRRSKKSVIDIDVNGIYFDYSVYPEDSYYANKLYLLINEFEIVDKVPTSSWNKFLSAQTPVEHPMLKLKLMNVRPIPSEPSLESIINLEVSPLRFYIDQDTLLKFAEILSFCNIDTESDNRTPTAPTNEDTPKKDNSNQIYLRKVNISELRIIVDYKPKQFSFNSLKDGQYGQILNILPLKDATLNFKSLKFYGLSGIDKLVQNVIEKYLPQAINQVPSIVLYIGPIRPFFKISEKMVDLIKNVYNNYQNEQPMIPAIEEGARQILTTTTTETLKLISRLSQKAQTLFENIETELSTNKRVGDNYQNSMNQPSINYQYGIRYMDSGSGSVKDAVKAVPVIICRPIIKLTKVVSKTTTDVSNALDPRNKLENQKKYK